MYFFNEFRIFSPMSLAHDTLFTKSYPWACSLSCKQKKNQRTHLSREYKSFSSHNQSSCLNHSINCWIPYCDWLKPMMLLWLNLTVSWRTKDTNERLWNWVLTLTSAGFKSLSAPANCAAGIKMKWHRLATALTWTWDQSQNPLDYNIPQRSRYWEAITFSNTILILYKKKSMIQSLCSDKYLKRRL